MTAIRVKPTQFTGTGKVFGRDPDALAAIIRGLAIDNARIALEKSAVPALTDNSTGTAAAALVVLPEGTSGAIDATSSGGAATSNLTTSLGKQANALQVLTQSINNARARLGLKPIVNAYGTQASANTIPAQDTASTSASGTSAVSYASAFAAFEAMQSKLASIALYMGHVFVALGYPAPALHQGQVAPPLGYVLGSTPALASVAAGPGALAKADADAYLAAFANNLATLAAYWNEYVIGASSITAFTDSTGGTAATALAANSTPAAATGAATTSAPKAGFDTQLALINNVCASLTAKTNQLLGLQGLPLLTNSTGGTVSNTLASESVSLSAVDGSSGTSAVDVVTASARMATIDNNLSSINAQLVKLAALYDVVPPGTDALAGTVSTTIAAVSATGTGVGGGTNTTMLASAVNTWLTNNRNNISTLAALINEMVGSSEPLTGLHVVAG